MLAHTGQIASMASHGPGHRDRGWHGRNRECMRTLACCRGSLWLSGSAREPSLSRRSRSEPASVSSCRVMAGSSRGMPSAAILYRHLLRASCTSSGKETVRPVVPCS